MKEDNFELLLDDEKLNKAYKNARFKSTIRTILILILVLVPMYIVFTNINKIITFKIGVSYYEEQEKVLSITNPNTYISEAHDEIGIFGARGRYTLSKRIGEKAIKLYDETSRYGFIGSNKSNNINFYQSGAGGHTAGEWPVNFDNAGNLRMMAFHPEIKYKEYKNDLALLNKVSSDSLLEMTLSFDKKYNLLEMLSILPNANIVEVLIDGYTEEQMNKYIKEALEYDGKATFINEHDFIGLAVSPRFKFNPSSDLSERYEEYLRNLQYDYKHLRQYKSKFNTIYSVLKEKDQLIGTKVDIIGVVVQGTPEELEKLKANPHIKASSAGTITTKAVIFK